MNIHVPIYKNIFFGCISFVIFLLIALYITYPLIFHMTNYVNGELVIAWILNWDIHAITHGIWPFFDGNIFFPYHNTLAYSDLFLTSSIIAMPFYFFIREPMLPSNVTFLSSLVLVGFFTYVLVVTITKNMFASILSGMLIVFSPVFLDKVYHLQIMAIEWIPLSLCFFLLFIQTKHYRNLFFSLLFFLLQTYNNFMAGYFLLFCYGGIVLVYFLMNKDALTAIITRKTILYFLIACALIIPICVPYFQVSNQFHFVRDIRETIHLALQPEDLLVTNSTSRLSPFLQFFDRTKYPPTAEIKPGFLGGIFTLLSSIAVIFASKKYISYRQKSRLKKTHTQYTDILLFAFISIAVVGLALSLGPVLHLGRVTIHHPFLIPLPYALTYYLLPGFQGFRDSSAFEMLFVLTMPVAIGITLDEILKKKSIVIKIAFYICAFGCIVLEYNGMQFASAYTFSAFPPVYSWIQMHTPKRAVIAEQPMYDWNNNPFGDNQEVLREYFSVVHFRKLLSGGSGFSPFPWQAFAQKEFANFPSPESIQSLKTYGATYIVVHAKEFDTLHNRHYVAGSHTVYSSAYVLHMLSQNKAIHARTKVGDDYVYAL